MVRAALCVAVLLATGSSDGLAQDGAPAPATGIVSGQIIDDASGAPIVDAGVEIVGQGKPARTDVDGRYSIRVPPGIYDLRVFAPLYRSMRVQGVQVRPEQMMTADVALASAGEAGIDVVEVVGIKQATEAAQLAKRQKSSEVRDTISAEAMKKAGGGNAADIVAQAPSVIVKDDKYINIRGLQERYTGALLNGNRLPSTDPTRRVVPLDLFPAGFLDSISIVKSYSPNLPGDFSGGLVELDLRDFPDKLEYGLGLSTGGNTQATFRPFNTYRGPSLDYFGFGTKFREMAAGTPGEVGLINTIGSQEQNRIGRQFRNIWAVDSVEAPPNFGLSGSYGNRWGPLGLQLGVTYGNAYKHRRNEIANNFTNANNFEDPVVQINDAILYDRSIFDTKLGGLLTASYDLAPGQRVTFRSLYNRNSNDQVFLGKGYRTNDLNIPVRTQVLQYTMEELYWLQLAGEHRWSWINVDWRSVYSRSTQKQPDSRYFTQIGQAGPNPNPYRFTTDALGGTRLFNDLQEWLSDSAVDFTVPFKTGLPFTDVWSGLPASFKFGPAYAYRYRNFLQRRFRNRPSQGCETIETCLDPSLPPDELFAPSNIIGPGGFNFVEESRLRDSYNVSQEIAAFYAMFELPIVKDRFKIIGGTRYEYSFIDLNTFSDLGVPERVIRNNKNPIPGLSLIFTPRDDMTVRLAYGHTVSRPDFRELSPAIYLAPLGLVSTRGNPFLVQSVINSYDARWDWFFGPLELVSFSIFNKELSKPIEEIVLPQSANPLQSWANAVSGRVTGFEFEGRKNFGFLGPRARFLGRFAQQLQNVAMQLSVTYAHSSVSIPRGVVPGLEDVQSVQTNTERPLQGQAPFIINAALEYSEPTIGTVRLTYNTVGDYIVLIGTNGLPDVMNQRRNQLDLVLIKPLQEWIGLPLTATLNVDNIFNQRVNWGLGDFEPTATVQKGKAFVSPGVQSGTVKRFTTGVGFSFGLSYSF